MPPTTEIARVRLNSPTAIKSDAFQGSLSTLSKQPGYVGTSYGMGIEDGDLLYWLVDWDSIKDHKNFMSSPQYETFMESLGSLTAGPPDIRHVKFESYSTKSMTAPITELFDMYLPASASNEKKQELADASSNLIKAILNDEGSEGAMDGHVVESVSHKSLGDEEGHALMAIIGWKSMENHTEFRNSESFKASIGPVRAAVKGAAMGHAILQKY